jgi:hypothetical protein
VSGSRDQAMQVLKVLRDVGMVGRKGVVREENVVFAR